jgi:ssDNA-binding replication factor A large subunit
MKKSILKLAGLSLLAAAIALSPTQGLAQEKKKDNATAPEGGKKKREGLPLSGKVVNIDKTAKTVKVGEQTIQITSETRIRKGNKEATLDDGVVGEEAGIYYKKDGEKLVALTVRFGPRPEGTGKGQKKETKKE